MALFKQTIKRYDTIEFTGTNNREIEAFLKPINHRWLNSDRAETAYAVSEDGERSRAIVAGDWLLRTPDTVIVIDKNARIEAQFTSRDARGKFLKVHS